MRKLLITTIAVLAFVNYATAQNAKSDLTITGTYRINTIMPLGKFRLYATISNKSKSDYKDITYKVEYVAGDGTIEGSKNYVLHDFIGPGISKKLKDQYIECPKDCKSINLSIASGKKLD